MLLPLQQNNLLAPDHEKYNAWGNSWLRAWGNSWGNVVLEPEAEAKHTGGGTDSHVNLVKLREGIKRAQEERDRLEAERLAEIEREASEVLARIARANEPEPSEPVVIPIPEAIEPEQVAQVEPLAPVNDLVLENTSNLLIDSEVSNEIYTGIKQSSYISERDEDEALALIMILAEID